MRLCIIGTGYVGLTTGVCLAHLGNHVICIDRDADRIEQLKKGIIPIHEDGLAELMEESMVGERLEFSKSFSYGVTNSDVLFITVGTPSLSDGDVDLTAVKEVAQDIARCMDGYKIIVNKSTVPVGTQKLVTGIIEKGLSSDTGFDVLSNPEFLREGNAVVDTMHPDRVVIGADNMEAAKVLSGIYAPMGGRIMFTSPESAEMIKYASNAFLAAKISFINEIANLCEKVGADVSEVALGMGLDSRIAMDFLKAGLGYGGSCFPKDTRALVRFADGHGCSLKLVKSAIEINEMQRLRPIQKLKDSLGQMAGKIICVLGLSFKPNTDDIRETPSLDIIREIKKLGGRVKVYDPKAMPNARKVLEEVEYCTDAYQAARDAHALILVTEWEQFKKLDPVKLKKLMKRPIFIDGRNVYDADSMIELGFEYYCIGKKDYGWPGNAK